MNKPSQHNPPQHNPSQHNPPPEECISQKNGGQNPRGSRKAPPSPSLAGVIHSLIPTSVYNPKTKKLFGVLSSEDLLIIALIFLFLENDEEDNSMTVLALIYILLSDYVDLSGLLL